MLRENDAKSSFLSLSQSERLLFWAYFLILTRNMSDAVLFPYYTISFHRLGMYRDSEKQLKSALRDQDMVDTYLYLCKVYVRLDQPLTAIECFKKVSATIIIPCMVIVFTQLNATALIYNFRIF